MKIRILFFGAIADSVGMRDLELDITEGAALGEVLAKLKDENHGLNKHKLFLALNEEYASLDTSVRNGDTMAIFTVVSGG